MRSVDYESSALSRLQLISILFIVYFNYNQAIQRTKLHGYNKNII